MKNRNEYNNEYKKQVFDRLVFFIKPEVHTKIKELAAAQNIPAARLVLEALEDVYNLDLHTRHG